MSHSVHTAGTHRNRGEWSEWTSDPIIYPNKHRANRPYGAKTRKALRRYRKQGDRNAWQPVSRFWQTY